MSSTGSYRADHTRLHTEPTPPTGEIALTVNGAARAAPAGLNVAGLLIECGLANKPCAVEVNKKLVPKARHATTVLNTGDVVELVTLVGGG